MARSLTSDATGALYRIPEASWTAISKRVGLCIFAQDSAPTIARYLPSFPALLAACQQWKNSTFGQISVQSGAVAAYASAAIADFTTLNAALAKLLPNDPLPDNVRTRAQKTIQDLATATAALNSSFSALAGDITTFIQQNVAVDVDLNAYLRQMGPTWASLNPDTSAVDNAVNLTLGAIQALADDLNAIATNPITITTPLLSSLQINVAILSWQNLQQEMAAFAVVATNQQYYLNGPSLTAFEMARSDRTDIDEWRTPVSQTYNVSPGAIANPAIPGGPAFALSTPQWLTIQTYVNDGLALPTTEALFRLSLGPGAPADLSDFTQLITAYQSIYGHVSGWQKTTYPATVQLASDIYEYGMNVVPVYYPAMVVEANKLIANPGDTQAAAALKAIIQVAQQKAQDNADKATASANAIAQFAQATQADNVVLGDPGSGLVKYYNDKYGQASQAVTDLNKDIIAQKILLDSDNADYARDVTIAATTPSYAWIWPAGTIAAAVVAGIYGHRAVEALHAAEADQAQIDSDNAQIQADANLMVAINHAQGGLNQIKTDLVAAQTAIGLVQGVWAAMADDLTALVTLIEQQISAVPLIIINLGVDSAVLAWHNVALAADSFRGNAYIQVGAATTPFVSTIAAHFTQQRSRARSGRHKLAVA